MPIAFVRSSMDVPSYPLRQKTLSAISRASSTSNVRGRPVGTTKSPNFCTYRYNIPLDLRSPPEYIVPVSMKLAKGGGIEWRRNWRARSRSSRVAAAASVLPPRSGSWPRAYVFITGRRQGELDAAARRIGENVTAVQGDVSNLADLDRLYATVEREQGRIDVLFANAGGGEFAPLGTITEEHFDKTFAINVKGVLFTVQKAPPLFRDGVRSS